MPALANPTRLFRARWVGFLGALLLSTGAAGAGVLPRPDGLRALPVLHTLRTGAGVTLCVVVAAVGMAALVGAWLLAGRSGELTARWVIVTAAWWSLPLIVAPPLFSRDVYSYAAQGDLLVHGLDPYQDGPAALPSHWLSSISPTWYQTPAPYGPLFLQLARLAVLLCGGHLPVAILLLRLVALAGIGLIAGYGPRLAQACGVPVGQALWLGLASPLLLAHFVSGAHNDALMVGLLVAGLACAAERRGVAAAVLIALAAAVKAPALVVLPFAALLWSTRGALPATPGTAPATSPATPGTAPATSPATPGTAPAASPATPGPAPGPRWAVARATALVGVVAAVTFATVTLVTGLGIGWIGAALRTPGASVQWTSLPTGLGVAAGWVVSGLGHPGAVDTCIAVARAAGGLLMLVVLVGLWWRARRHPGDTRLVVAAAGWALFTVVVLAPAFHPWYLLWAAVPLAFSTGDSRPDARIRTGLVAASAALCFLVLPDGYNLARATAVPGVLLDLAVTALLVAAGIRWLRSRRGTAEPTGTPADVSPVGSGG